VAAQVNPTLVAGGAVYSSFEFSPDSQTIAYIADQDTDQVLELYSVPVSTPGNSDRLNGNLVAEGDVCRFEWSPDSARVAYCGDQDTDEVHELYVVELAQPGVSTKLNPALVPGGEVSPTFRFSPDSGKVYYIASQDTAGVDELYGVAVAAPQATTKLNDPLANGGEVVWFRQRPDGSRLGYIADQEVDEFYDLYEADPANPGTAVRMTPDAAGSGVYDFLYSSDGTKIVYSSSQDDDFSDLYRLDTANPGDSTRLNAAMVAGGEVWSFNLTE
jgi:Tol biopolymer transport system component